jgi:hypothetical protein
MSGSAFGTVVPVVTNLLALCLLHGGRASAPPRPTPAQDAAAALALGSNTRAAALCVYGACIVVGLLPALGCALGLRRTATYRQAALEVTAANANAELQTAGPDSALRSVNGPGPGPASRPRPPRLRALSLPAVETACDLSDGTGTCEQAAPPLASVLTVGTLAQVHCYVYQVHQAQLAADTTVRSTRAVVFPLGVACGAVVH